MTLLEYIQRINESFADAQRIFARDNDPDQVKSTLDQFRRLSQKNIIKGQDRDITTWIHTPFEKFKKFVDQSETEVSKTQQKTSHKSDSIKLHDDDEWLVVAPLTKEASQYYGKGTKWCTAAVNHNAFNSYFLSDDTTLIYIISKTSDAKYAIAAKLQGGPDIKCFDANDKIVSVGEVANQTKLPINDYIGQVNSNYELYSVRSKNKVVYKEKMQKAIEKTKVLIQNAHNLYQYSDDELRKIKTESYEVAVEDFRMMVLVEKINNLLELRLLWADFVKDYKESSIFNIERAETAQQKRLIFIYQRQIADLMHMADDKRFLQTDAEHNQINELEVTLSKLSKNSR